MFIIFFLSKDLAPINVLCIFLDPSLKARIPIDIKFDDLTVSTGLLIQQGSKYLIMIVLLVI